MEKKIFLRDVVLDFYENLKNEQQTTQWIPFYIEDFYSFTLFFLSPKLLENPKLIVKITFVYSKNLEEFIVSRIKEMKSYGIELSYNIKFKFFKTNEIEIQFKGIFESTTFSNNVSKNKNQSIKMLNF